MRSNTFAQRLFSLTGLVPLATFAVLHVIEQARRVLGEGSGAIEQFAATPVARVLLLWAPLAYHALYGLALVVTRRSIARPQATPTIFDGLLRISGVIALAFVLWHAFELRGSGLVPSRDAVAIANELYATSSATWFGVPFRALAYLVGSTSVAFHLAYGAHLALVGWGLVSSPEGSRRLGLTLAALAVAWLVLAAGTTLKAATGTILPF